MRLLRVENKRYPAGVKNSDSGLTPAWFANANHSTAYCGSAAILAMSQ
jgi:hypothetical protein